MIEIKSRPIGPGHSPYVIAELGINHNGDLSTAKRLIEVAAECGADAAKLQTFTTENFISRSSGYFDLLKGLELPPDAIRSLIDLAETIGITLFTSVFDDDSADLWDRWNVPAFKIASGELTHLPLMRYVATKGRPMIISTGGGTMEEISNALAAVRSANSGVPVAILHCVSNYPTAASDANLACMAGMRDRFGVPIGFSDHTPGIGTAIAAAALGADIIEKHFTLDNNMQGPDHALSTTPRDFKLMVDCIHEAHEAIGTNEKRPIEPDEFIPLIRRSLTAKRLIPKGSTLTAEMFAFKRPGLGINPGDFDKLMGRTTNQDIPADVAITWSMLGE